MDLEAMDSNSLDDSDFVKTEDLDQDLDQYDIDDMMNCVGSDCKEIDVSCSSNDAAFDTKPPNIKGSSKIGPMCSVCKVVPYQFHHFGAFVCNRCRAFFRRTVRRIRRGGIVADCLITKQPYTGFTKPTCDITLFRGACQACRFATCIEQGMNPETVLTDQARNLKYAKSTEKEPKVKRKSSRPSTRASRASMSAPEPAAASSSVSTGSHIPLPPNSFYYEGPVERPPWLEDSWSFTVKNVASTQFLVPADIAPRKP